MSGLRAFGTTTDLRCTFWYACGALLTRGFMLSMSGWRKLYYKLLNLPLSFLVKSKAIPADPVSEHGLDPTRPIMYVLPYDSKADLLTLRAQCIKHDLPDPLSPWRLTGYCCHATFLFTMARACFPILCPASSQ